MGFPANQNALTIAIVLVVAWFLLKIILKLTAKLFKIGCGVIFLIVAAYLLMNYLA